MKHQTDLKYTPPFAVLLPLMYIIVLFCHNPIIAQASNTEKTLMAVFAHPDDEITAGAILNKYAEEGVKVYLVVATDGRFGTNDRTAHVAGDGLAALRREEMQCSADKLGIELIHLEYEDQLRSAGGYDGHIPHIRALMKDIYDIIERTQPDAIITFGPDGWSNHMDHRLVGASVTQAFLSKKWGKPINLFFVGRPSNGMEDPERKILAGQDIGYLTTKVPYSEKNRDTFIHALACHKSQFGEDALERMMERRSKDEEKVVYLRKFVGPTESSDTVFNQ
ncbi:PIG-L deacetylase family protein [Flagellimonas marinaquae]|uniref:PIG-L deacetylase family protein n=1 Tax=Flagellimonas marinaquae TaxID=254955 RepID=UPI002075B256|nr:PIG-L deacetylase family protein [Allomuricauda aquimarina]USD25931.1 PIG-L family deacetylase [Allomuricauda aquimarina]